MNNEAPSTKGLDEIHRLIARLEEDGPVGVEAHVDAEYLRVKLSDGRWIAVPITWYPRLAAATLEQRSDWRWSGSRRGIHWPQIDEDLFIAGMLVPPPRMSPSERAQSMLARGQELAQLEVDRLLSNGIPVYGRKNGVPVTMIRRNGKTVSVPTDDDSLADLQVVLDASKPTWRARLIATVKRWLGLGR